MRCRLPEYGVRVGPGVEGGPQGLLQAVQALLPAEDDVKASDFLPDHFLHILRGLQDVISMPQFRQGHVQVRACGLFMNR